jgi:alpha-1,3-rhamnosyl/mannosyltransferase
VKVILSIDPLRFPLTGIGRYTFELAKHLGSIPQIERIRFFAGRRLVDTLPSPEEHKQGNAAPSSFRKQLLKNQMTVGAYRLVYPLIKRYALRNYSDHIYHGPNFYLPPFGGRSVCTFHDLSVFTWAHCHPPERVKFMRKEIEFTLKRADMLITDSEYTRQELASYFSWPLDKIRAVPLASSENFRRRTGAELQTVLKKLDLQEGGYSLYVGTIEPRKNLEVLLDAYSMLPKSVRQHWPLVLIGHRGWQSEHLHARIEVAIKEGWARYLGFVNAEELPLIYAGARLFVFPSLYEGFGLPILEAMASGIPVVCSNASTLPEVAGDAAAMCAPGDVDLLSYLIARGLEEVTWRDEARRKGLMRAAAFSWQRCATETAAVYSEVSR